jgi:WD40 repeat protein
VLTTVGFSDGTIQLRTVDAAGFGAPMTLTISADEEPYDAQFSPDGSLLAVGDTGGRVSFWAIPLSGTTPVGTDIIFPPNSGGWIQTANGLSFARSGTYLAVSSGSFNAGGAISVWDVASRGVRGRKVPTYYPISVAYAPNGRAIAAGETTCGKVLVCAD